MVSTMRRLFWTALIGTLMMPALASAQDVVVYYHTDAIGSVRVVTDDTGAVVARYDYLPFGERWDPQPSPDVRQFAGKERDAETGLDYFGARYYASQTGRFTTVDPGHVNGDIFDPQSWNAYAYARNNPLRYTDPDGREYEICVEGGYSCQRVSDQRFAYLQGNPGAGIQLSAGYIYAGGRGVGTYRQTSLDPTFSDFARRTGELSSRWLREQSTEMAKGAVITAATFGAGLAVRVGAEAIMGARAPTVAFKIGAANMTALSGAGIDASTAKAAARLLIQSRLGPVPAVGTRIEGFVEINGRVLKVTAGVNAAGEISVGAIRVVR